MIKDLFVNMRAVAASAAALLFFAGTALAVPAAPLNPDAQVIDDAVSLFMRDFKVPGVAVALYYKGKAYTYCYGYADLAHKKQVTDDTIFEIASITKVFTATSLAWEVLAERMQLQDPISKYLPGLPKQDSPFAGITLYQLATHTSSLPRTPPQKSPQDHSPYSTAEMTAWLKGWTPQDPIGSKYAYSNLGYGLLGFALSAHSAIPYEQIIRQEILQPLGMNSTFVTVPEAYKGLYAVGYGKGGEIASHYPSTIWPGGGALRSTNHDMLQFLMANLGVKGPPHLLQAMKFAQKGFFRVNDTLVLGLGWQIIDKSYKLKIVDKNGGVSGFSSYIGMVPEKTMGIVILTNKGKARAATLGRAILERLADKQEKKK